jgi:UDPglucose--hexose-1-phosphate uridylyltransferase
MVDQFNRSSHRRFNPLTGDWVLVSPQRTQRPWQGQVEKRAEPDGRDYDPGCYLCPGNARAGGIRNPQYESTFVFTNDFAALKPDIETGRSDACGRGLLVAENERGTCRVVCFSPQHNLTLSRMSVDQITTVIDLWASQFREIGSLPYINYVQIFENRGEIMGCSNPHPHCQIWANETIPNEPLKEQRSQREYLQKHASCLLCDTLLLESEACQRVVCENDHFMALVPFWAIWPFETSVISKAHAANLLSLDGDQRRGFADILKRLTTRYDNLFAISFPYSMGLHQAPTDGQPHPEWHFHLHFYPPLLRSATVRKFMVGYEMLAAPQRDITPESAAERLRACAEE